jgi:hypothetical protein
MGPCSPCGIQGCFFLSRDSPLRVCIFPSLLLYFLFLPYIFIFTFIFIFIFTLYLFSLYIFICRRHFTNGETQTTIALAGGQRSGVEQCPSSDAPDGLSKRNRDAVDLGMCGVGLEAAVGLVCQIIDASFFFFVVFFGPIV